MCLNSQTSQFCIKMSKASYTVLKVITQKYIVFLNRLHVSYLLNVLFFELHLTCISLKPIDRKTKIRISKLPQYMYPKSKLLRFNSSFSKKRDLSELNSTRFIAPIAVLRFCLLRLPRSMSAIITNNNHYQRKTIVVI